MKHWLKLINFEFNRFAKVLIGLMGITLILQFIAVITVSEKYLNQLKKVALSQGVSPLTMLNSDGKMGSSFEKMDVSLILKSNWFTASLAIGAVVIAIYIFAIWYRDWSGRGQLAYQLLMLPLNRLAIFTAKAATIFLSTLCLVAYQWVLLLIEKLVMNLLVAPDYRTSLSLLKSMEQNRYMSLLLPADVWVFIFSYLIGLMIVIILFTGILIERSFRIKGIVGGLIYAVVAIGLFVSPVLIDLGMNSYFYPIEIVTMEIVLGVLISGISVCFSHYLLHRKVTV